MFQSEPRALRSLAHQTLKRTAAAADRVRPPAPGVVVLIYHRVGGGSGLELDLPVDQFDAQMASLAELGTVMTLDDALVALEEERQVGANPVVVTFDDGTDDFADQAVPVLERYRIPATLYVATAFVHRGESLPYGAPPASWAGLRDALSTGLVSIGSHTHAHCLLDRLPAEEIAFELDEPTRLIERELQVTPSHFAYPDTSIPLHRPTPRCARGSGRRRSPARDRTAMERRISIVSHDRRSRLPTGCSGSGPSSRAAWRSRTASGTWRIGSATAARFRERDPSASSPRGGGVSGGPAGCEWRTGRTPPGGPRSAARLAELTFRISEGFLPQLGPAFLTRLYRRIVASPDGFATVAVLDDVVVDSPRARRISVRCTSRSCSATEWWPR